ncbi:MAG: hypothetical protein JW901_09865 [Dehalococcoidia bacterium]|nr:hypothetical protein [Dehalococcoidia bacterium]
MKYWLIVIGLLALGLAALFWPLQITDILVADDGNCLCVSWQTNLPADCEVTFCKDGQCYIAGAEYGSGRSHLFIVPERNVEKIGIQATSYFKTAYMEVVP